VLSTSRSAAAGLRHSRAPNKLGHYQLPSLLDMRPALALLHGYDKQSVGELVGSTVETSRCGPGENRSLAEGVGSNRWQPGSSHKEWCAEEEG